MKKFKLEALLKYRKLQEEKAQQVLADAVNSEISVKGELQKCCHNLKDLYSELEKRQAEGMSLDSLALYRDHICHLAHEISNLEESQTRAESLVESRRQLLAEASRDKKMIENLKVKTINAYNDEIARHENAMLDEVAIQKGRR